jgi:hypothetical protein
MQIPPLGGTFPAREPCIYTACDSEYFSQFAPAFIHSALANSGWPLHLHLYNPTESQLAQLYTIPNLSVTWEHLPLADLDPSVLPAYYAAARFIRLAQVFGNHAVFCMDIDAVVRSTVPKLSTRADLYLHRISTQPRRFLAGGVYLNSTQGGHQFIQQFADQLSTVILANSLSWGSDQRVLNTVALGYKLALLPKSLVDWDLHQHSSVWTAKGARKNQMAFVAEQARWSAPASER